MFKFIHAADIHLDSPLSGLERYEGAPVDEIRSATRRAFDNLIEFAINEQVAFVLIAGDLYDGDWKDYNTGLYFVERMARLANAGIRTYIIAGNHDAASQITKHLPLPDKVSLFDTRKPQTEVLDDLGVAIIGQGFATRAVEADISLNYPQGDAQLLNIGLLHTCLDGKPGHAPYAPCSIDGLRSKGYQYWALGHVHQREVVSQEPWIVFPGNIQGRHIRETGAKGCTLVSVENGEICAVEHRDLDVMRWSLCKLDISGCGTTDQLYDLVRETLENELTAADGRVVAARLVLQGASRLHAALQDNPERWIQEFRAIATGLQSAGLWLEKVSIDTRSLISAEDQLAGDDALSGLLQSIQRIELDEDALTELALEIAPLRSKLPAEILSQDDPANQQGVINALEDIKQLLATRLLATEPSGSSEQ
ncbi:MAG: DNA repair exonuclease [Pseudomonadales bacterium]|nr:DNA repair exonuclease [Pseudomonadales bacterium]